MLLTEPAVKFAVDNDQSSAIYISLDQFLGIKLTGMFERRKKLGFGSKLLLFFWPAAGFRRAGRYMMHRLSRLPGTPYTLAAGFACGAAASFTPLVGFHFIFAAFLAWVIRADILASAIGTAVGNPWTFPFIWLWLYNLGNWLGFGDKGVDVLELNFPQIFGKLVEACLNADFSTVADIAGPVIWPMFMASIPTAVVVWVFCYFPLRRIVKSYQRARLERRTRQSDKHS